MREAKLDKSEVSKKWKRLHADLERDHLTAVVKEVYRRQQLVPVQTSRDIGGHQRTHEPHATGGERPFHLRQSQFILSAPLPRAPPARTTLPTNGPNNYDSMIPGPMSRMPINRGPIKQEGQTNQAGHSYNPVPPFHSNDQMYRASPERSREIPPLRAREPFRTNRGGLTGLLQNDRTRNNNLEGGPTYGPESNGRGSSR